MVLQATVSLAAVFVAAVVSMLIGAIWYSPSVFGRDWLAALGVKDKKAMAKMKKESGKAYTGHFITDLIKAFMLAVIVDYAGATTALTGAAIGLLVWLGFVATTIAGSVFFEGKNLELFMIDSTYSLVSLIFTGIIVATL